MDRHIRVIQTVALSQPRIVKENCDEIYKAWKQQYRLTFEWLGNVYTRNVDKYFSQYHDEHCYKKGTENMWRHPCSCKLRSETAVDCMMMSFKGSTPILFDEINQQYFMDITDDDLEIKRKAKVLISSVKMSTIEMSKNESINMVS